MNAKQLFWKYGIPGHEHEFVVSYRQHEMAGAETVPLEVIVAVEEQMQQRGLLPEWECNDRESRLEIVPPCSPANRCARGITGNELIMKGMMDAVNQELRERK